MEMRKPHETNGGGTGALCRKSAKGTSRWLKMSHSSQPSFMVALTWSSPAVRFPTLCRLAHVWRKGTLCTSKGIPWRCAIGRVIIPLFCRFFPVCSPNWLETPLPSGPGTQGTS